MTQPDAATLAENLDRIADEAMMDRYGMANRNGSDWGWARRTAEIALRTPPVNAGQTITEDALERWADIQDDNAAIVACGERWKAVASVIGCRLHGFNDGFSASFFTPDGNVIEVGPKFRAALASLPVGDDGERNAVLEEAARVCDKRAGLAGEILTDRQQANTASQLAARIRALKNPTVPIPEMTDDQRQYLETAASRIGKFDPGTVIGGPNPTEIVDGEGEA